MSSRNAWLSLDSGRRTLASAFASRGASRLRANRKLVRCTRECPVPLPGSSLAVTIAWPSPIVSSRPRCLAVASPLCMITRVRSSLSINSRVSRLRIAECDPLEMRRPGKACKVMSTSKSMPGSGSISIRNSLRPKTSRKFSRRCAAGKPAVVIRSVSICPVTRWRGLVAGGYAEGGGPSVRHPRLRCCDAASAPARAWPCSRPGASIAANHRLDACLLATGGLMRADSCRKPAP